MTGAGNGAEHRSFLRIEAGADGAEILDRIRTGFGFLPNFFRVQGARPDLIESELGLIEGILGRQGALSRQQKEYIFLICSAANLSTYCVTAHCEIVRMLGIEGPEPEQVALDHTAADLSMQFKGLLNFAAKLNRSPDKIAEADVNRLRTFGYSDEHILEAVLMVGLARFVNLVSLGLGLVPDFDNPEIAQTIAARTASLRA